MGSKNPVTDAERERVRELHAAGKGRNEIAKILGRSGRTINDIAQSLGLSFGRAAQVQQATEIRTADLAARRAATAQRLQDVAERELEKLDKPHTYFDWGGKDHDLDTYEAPEPTPADKRALMGVVATDLDRSLKLAPPKQEGGADQVGSLLTNLFDQLRDRHGDH
ncbi:helix-turn-helix domain-containing protein [Streptomyces sp. NBC_01462]|uniref:helix-turn-helix domain-containing protein n=1 Tax=Streptomyces sp. NBC_01462 TaxID=2903876 RepID=UPI002E368781|nr:helix-turn-helix domain-containing protein [Streptomyces sp. NBC_01462]